MTKACLCLVYCLYLLNVLLNPGSTYSQELKAVKVAQFGKEKFLLYLPLYYAIEEGYFKQAGLAPEIIFAGNDDQVFATVASGSADFGVGDPIFAAIAEHKGLSAKVVALLVQRLSNTGLAARADLKPLTKIEDFKDLRIGTFPQPSTTFSLLTELLLQHRNQVGKASLIEAQIGSMTALLSSGTADIVFDLEPAASIAEAKGFRVVTDLARFTPPQAITGITVRGEFLQNNMEVANKFVGALDRALSEISNDSEQALKVAIKLFPDLKPAVLKTALVRMHEQEVFPQTAKVKRNLWNRSIELRINSGALAPTVSKNLGLDLRFVEEK